MTNEAELRRAPFSAGDIALAYDRRERRYRIELREDGLFETHMGYVPHDRIIGRQEGFFVLTNKGHRIFVLRPWFADAVRELPRQSQVIYPKDLGALLMHADIFPGARIIEVGLGSGAASAALLRAVGPSGSVVSHEIREDIIPHSRHNISQLAPDADNHHVIVGDAYANGIGEGPADCVVVDVPEPWRLLDSATHALRTGGVFAAYLPTVLQSHELTMRLARDPHWHLAESIELLERTWHFSETSARPNHRMVGHTGFITTVRRCEPPPGSPGENQIE